MICIEIPDASAIERTVNSEEVKNLPEGQRWEDVWSFINTNLPPLTQEMLDRLEWDLRDWWKNGNLWDGGWEIGEWPFWTEPIE
jgi:hypothetical protein